MINSIYRAEKRIHKPTEKELKVYLSEEIHVEAGKSDDAIFQVSLNGDTCYFHIAGSNDFEDWLNNKNTTEQEYKGTTYFSGMLKEFHSIARTKTFEEVVRKISSCKYNVISGHRYGGVALHKYYIMNW
eukprot:UN03443